MTECNPYLNESMAPRGVSHARQTISLICLLGHRSWSLTAFEWRHA